MNIKKLISTFIIVGGFFSGFSFAESSQEFTGKDGNTITVSDIKLP